MAGALRRDDATEAYAIALVSNKKQAIMPFDFEKNFEQATINAVKEIMAGGPILDSMPEHVGGYRDAAVVSIRPKKTFMEKMFDYMATGVDIYFNTKRK